MTKWGKEIKNLKAHEIIILDSLKKKDKEVKSAEVEEVRVLHQTARDALLTALVATVKKRNQFEFKTFCWYGDVTDDEDAPIFVESEEESAEKSEYACS